MNETRYRSPLRPDQAEEIHVLSVIYLPLSVWLFSNPVMQHLESSRLWTRTSIYGLPNDEINT